MHKFLIGLFLLTSLSAFASHKECESKIEKLSAMSIAVGVELQKLEILYSDGEIKRQDLYDANAELERVIREQIAITSDACK